ncbi:hypothetical protein F7734_16640 [Scytonema sp. UIC 10036]|uniref:hypothetical protein n=1 Tax=Scytonema sp. UIC 10036 TaxID=2304196 RepID=UPI0012DA11C5|nr:hypothetical protein [Scytonema sp. UIC 10036]MUG93938.1 hypothetical protein [Scytonema sp. UIC 10036]
MIDIQALKSVRSFIREVIAKVFTHQFGATKGKLTAMHSPAARSLHILWWLPKQKKSTFLENHMNI